jgi:hypothetical protein
MFFVNLSGLSDEKAQHNFSANTPAVVQDKCAPEAHTDRREPAVASPASAKAQAVNAQDDGDSDHDPLAQYEDEKVMAIGLTRPS